MIIGVFGGTFDPPHYGHLGLAEIVLESGKVDQVWFIPVLKHRFDKAPAPFEHRVAMCRMLVEDKKGMHVSEIESELTMPGHTLDLVIALKVRHPNYNFRLVAGSDIYHERDKWHNYDDIIKLAPPLFVERRGIDPIPEPTLDAPAPVSSSILKKLIRAGILPASQVPRPILDYISDRGLYSENGDGQ